MTFINRRSAVRVGLWFALSSLALQTALAEDRELPRMSGKGAGAQLIVDGKPFIVFGGEVHNSAASSAAFMQPVWDRADKLHLNTMVLPVSWELVEPREGEFDFRLVDDLIRDARAHNMRLTFLWLATVKNARSTYAPDWVRADPARFPRAVTRRVEVPYDRRDPVLSVFSEATVAADAAAFARFMAHLAQADPLHTVIAIQVENETGILGDSRDRSAGAEAAWRKPVPPVLMAYLAANKGRLAPSLEALWARGGYRRTGTWTEVFGDDWQAEEVFMAWAMSRFTDRVAAAGKARKNLPLYTNAWLGPDAPAEQAGFYPSGGPVPRVLDVWKAGAPTLDWLSPDIYLPDYARWASAYVRPDNPLFVPEARLNVGNFFLTIGEYRGFGFSPYGINGGLPNSEIGQAYGLLDGTEGMIAAAQAAGKIRGFALGPGEVREVDFGVYRVIVRGKSEASATARRDMGQVVPDTRTGTVAQTDGEAAPEMNDPRPSGMLMELSPGRLLLIGRDLELTFRLRDGVAGRAELSKVVEGRYVSGVWTPGRVLNGDERWTMVPIDKIGMAQITLMNVPQQR